MQTCETCCEVAVVITQCAGRSNALAGCMLGVINEYCPYCSTFYMPTIHNPAGTCGSLALVDSPAGESVESWQSGEGRAAVQQRLQSVVDDYREADVAAAVERRRREQRRIAANHGGDDDDNEGAEEDGIDEAGEEQQEDDAEGISVPASPKLYDYVMV